MRHGEIPNQIEDCGLPIFYKIMLSNGNNIEARFDKLNDCWREKNTNMKIKKTQVLKWEKNEH